MCCMQGVGCGVLQGVCAEAPAHEKEAGARSPLAPREQVMTEAVWPEFGSRWQEVDPRCEGRIVEVVYGFDVIERKVRIKNTATGRITWARISRFNGKRGGYRLLAPQRGAE
jgi:hypothetical protein